MIKLLHFSDAHIDIASQGKRDPDTGLSIRVMDFLRALDTIIDSAINEKVDLVIFAGDAYKDRTPVPTFQREWGKRIVRLSNYGIPTILLVGNHDLSPAAGRASALQEFDTLTVPNVHLISKPNLIGPDQLGGLPIQIIALPWITRSGFLSTQQDSLNEIEDLDQAIESITTRIVENFLQKTDPDLPTIFTAHASVQSAVYGGERSIMLGNDIILPLGLVRNSDLDYVALGHIHKAQNLNEDNHPPVIYPGSIEKVDFGEANDDKYFVIAEIEKGNTKVTWHKLDGRVFLDSKINLKDISKEEGFIPTPDDIKKYMDQKLPDQAEVENTVIRLSITYPQGWENLIDDRWINDRFESALEFHLVRKPVFNTRLRLGEDETITNLPPESLLERYWESNHLTEGEIEVLKSLAMEIIYNRSEEEVS
jgi:exonuclease SbcD